MKPSFALSLSFEGIGLLHRSFPGWNRVGEVALDSPDLPGALAVLRETAEQINGALTSKLVIPNDQVKYLSLDLGVMSEAERRDVIRAALDGATPYPVDDLVYDWSVEGHQTQIAAVARDTLREAEDFAAAHGFTPVSFVATPPDGVFSGEPFFGPTQMASQLLAPGEEVQRDMAPIRVTGVARLPEPEEAEEPDHPATALGQEAATAAIEALLSETDTQQPAPQDSASADDTSVEDDTGVEPASAEPATEASGPEEIAPNEITPDEITPDETIPDDSAPVESASADAKPDGSAPVVPPLAQDAQDQPAVPPAQESAATAQPDADDTADETHPPGQTAPDAATPAAIDTPSAENSSPENSPPENSSLNTAADLTQDEHPGPPPVFISGTGDTRTDETAPDDTAPKPEEDSAASAQEPLAEPTFAHRPPEETLATDDVAPLAPDDGLSNAPTVAETDPDPQTADSNDGTDGPAPSSLPPEPTASNEPDEPAPALSFSTIRAERDLPESDAPEAPTPALGGVTRSDPGHGPAFGNGLTAPKIPIEDEPFEAVPDDTPAATVPPGEDALDDLPPMPSPAILAARAASAAEPLEDSDPSQWGKQQWDEPQWDETEWEQTQWEQTRGHEPGLAPQHPEGTFTAPADAPEQPEQDDASPAGRLAALSRKSGAVASGLASNLSGLRAGLAARQARRAEAVNEAEAAQAAVLPDPHSEEQRMTVFGARKSAQETPRVGGKPRYLGLILTLVLLVFLAGVAAWASIFGDEGVSRFFRGSPQVTDTAIAESEATALRDLAVEGDEAETPLPPDDTVETAAVDVTPAPQPTELRPQPARPHALTEEEAQARYAVTGVWQRAPNGPGLPDQENADDLYTASIDPTIDAQDALALPDAPGLASDAPPGNIGPTLAPGSRFEFDARGLVLATPDGTLNPEGVLIYAGKPPRVPGAGPDRDAEQAASDAADPEKARLSGIRPKPRPEGLVEESERQTLGGLTRTELAGKRPKLRPDQPFNEAQKAAIAAAAGEAQTTAQATAQAEAIAQAAAEAAAAAQAATPEPAADPFATGTALAVSQSRAPKLRPGNFSRIVKRTVQNENAEPAETTRVAAAVPRNQAVAPAAPSTATVAKAATVRNQLNLRRVNLIGVYGKPSARRALVRLANGRYKKVKVGDRLDGGQVQAIGEQELRYSKGGRNVVLKMPRG